MTNDFAYMAAYEIADLIRAREVSPVEVMLSTINRIEARNASMNAFVFTAFEEALENAKAAEDEIMRGDYKGPLHGIPTAMKDLFDFKEGWPSTLGGVPAMKDNIAENNCAYTERMEAAGAIIVGKTNSPTFGYRGTCDNFLFGPTGNPFNTNYNSGGSSGGSAAAVADGLVPIAEGTDGGGSIRIPAAWCNNYGFKPSFGRSPILIRPNAFGASTPFIHMGPITRNVKDAVNTLNALCGPHPGDPLAVMPKEDLSGYVGRPVSGMKVAFTEDFGIFPVVPEVRAAVRRTAEKLREAGVVVEDVKFDIKHSAYELGELWCKLFAPLNNHVLDSLKQNGVDLLSGDMQQVPDEFIKWSKYASEELTFVEHHRQQSIRGEIFDEFQRVLEGYDAIVSPTLACLPVLNEQNGDTMGPIELEGEQVEPLIGWCMTYFNNFTGHPAANVPAGLSKDGLPIGLHITGRMGADGDVIALSSAFELVAPWQQHYDVCKARVL
ncbi:amidase [Kordiimonas laminariae]|uniref:amidase n=1 Tax=Kordiimonas laminariae TaxID=2917717 RepID=UPI001FF3B6A4|nr:amidase [Kordiimonas laminariae]MCK0070612.1 amidase [Kordiimonas laminariae]